MILCFPTCLGISKIVYAYLSIPQKKNIAVKMIPKKVHVLNSWTGILHIVEKLLYHLFMPKKLLQELVRQDAICLGSGIGPLGLVEVRVSWLGHLSYQKMMRYTFW